MNKTEKVFNELSKDFSEEGKALIVGSVDEEHIPCVGVSGDTFCALVILAAAVRQLSKHTNNTSQETLNDLSKIIADAESSEMLRS